MAASRDTTAEHIKPLEGAIVRRFKAAATIAAGELVNKTSTANEVTPTDTTSVAVVAPVGVAIQGVASGDWLDVVVFGPVVCLSGATVGGLIYGSDTAGEPSETAGGKDVVFGFAETATILFVRPQVIDFT